MNSAPNSAVWLSDTLSPNSCCCHEPWLSYCTMPKVCSGFIASRIKNYTLKGCVPLFCTYWTDLENSDISFLLFTPAGRKGHMVTCTPKSFCTTAECDFFLILWFSSLRKAAHGIPRLAWLSKAACLPLMEHTFWSSYLAERWVMLTVWLLGLKLPWYYYSYTEDLDLVTSLRLSGTSASVLNFFVGAIQFAWKQFAF